ncbi:MAG: formate dehydrogenase accessory sulfurtransferase FdhD [Ilumatobacteraceae bacterium]
MGRGRSERVIVTKVAGLGSERSVGRGPDRLIVEEPMSIQLDGTLVATTMRTPGHDFELAVGFCLTEGMLGDAPVVGVRYCADGSALASEFNTVTVETGGRAPEPTPRLGNVSSSCGWCGSEQLDELVARLTPLPPSDPFDLDVLQSVPETVRGGQDLFAATGAVHGAAAFGRDGRIILLREDVGRHNAVDKVVGALLLERGQDSPGSDLGLFVSGRASVEMVQKAWAGGFAALVAVSAPTALAVDAARRANLLLAGFVRGDAMNIYSPERL